MFKTFSQFKLEKETAILEAETSDKQKAYQDFFKKKLEDWKIGSPTELSDEDKDKFFAEVKSEWKEEGGEDTNA